MTPVPNETSDVDITRESLKLEEMWWTSPSDRRQWALEIAANVYHGSGPESTFAASAMAILYLAHGSNPRFKKPIPPHIIDEKIDDNQLEQIRQNWEGDPNNPITWREECGLEATNS